MFVALCLGLTAISHSQTQPQPQAQSSGTQLAVIDISKIFKNHTRFKQAMEGMKTEVKNFETTLQQRGNQINELRKQMQPYDPGSAEYKQLEAQIMKVQADGQIAAAQKKKEFLEREAKIYFEVYTEVAAEVARFAEQHGIGLVIRFNSDPIDQKNRQAVLEGVNRAVIFQKHLNITNAILQRLEQAQVSQRPAAAPR